MSAICPSVVRWSATGSVSSEQFHRLIGTLRRVAFTDVAVDQDLAPIRQGARRRHAAVAPATVASCGRPRSDEADRVRGNILFANKHSAASLDQAEITSSRLRTDGGVSKFQL